MSGGCNQEENCNCLERSEAHVSIKPFSASSMAQLAHFIIVWLNWLNYISYGSIGAFLIMISDSNFEEFL
jgi:hypothetical protein